MANIGDNFITTLKDAHLRWGTHRYTNSRTRIYGEGYLQVPKKQKELTCIIVIKLMQIIFIKFLQVMDSLKI